MYVRRSPLSDSMKPDLKNDRPNTFDDFDRRRGSAFILDAYSAHWNLCVDQTQDDLSKPFILPQSPLVTCYLVNQSGDAVYDLCLSSLEDRHMRAILGRAIKV